MISIATNATTPPTIPMITVSMFVRPEREGVFESFTSSLSYFVRFVTSSYVIMLSVVVGLRLVVVKSGGSVVVVVGRPSHVRSDSPNEVKIVPFRVAGASQVTLYRLSLGPRATSQRLRVRMLQSQNSGLELSPERLKWRCFESSVLRNWGLREVIAESEMSKTILEDIGTGKKKFDNKLLMFVLTSPIVNSGLLIPAKAPPDKASTERPRTVRLRNLG